MFSLQWNVTGSSTSSVDVLPVVKGNEFTGALLFPFRGSTYFARAVTMSSHARAKKLQGLLSTPVENLIGHGRDMTCSGVARADCKQRRADRSSRSAMK